MASLRSEAFVCLTTQILCFAKYPHLKCLVISQTARSCYLLLMLEQDSSGGRAMANVGIWGYSNLETYVFARC